jgi:hypothetical protein
LAEDGIRRSHPAAPAPAAEESVQERSSLQIEGRFANEALQRFVTGQAERLGGTVSSSGGFDTLTFILGR